MMAFLRDTFEPVPLDKQILDQVIDADFEDLEDAIQYFSAVRAKSDCIVSRVANALPKPEAFHHDVPKTLYLLGGL